MGGKQASLVHSTALLGFLSLTANLNLHIYSSLFAIVCNSTTSRPQSSLFQILS